MPERLRVLGFVDTTLLWLNLGISLLVLVLPAYFDLSLKDALAATLVGALIGLLSGTYPSMRAASMEPVESLRAGTT